MIRVQCRGQASLEYLIVFGAFAAMLAVFLGVALNVFFLGLGALDVLHAKGFVESIQWHSRSLEVLGVGSASLVKGSAFNEWGIALEEGLFIVSVHDSKNGKIKTVQVPVENLSMVESKTIKGPFVVALQRVEEGVQLSFK